MMERYYAAQQVRLQNISAIQIRMARRMLRDAVAMNELTQAYDDGLQEAYPRDLTPEQDDDFVGCFLDKTCRSELASVLCGIAALVADSTGSYPDEVAPAPGVLAERLDELEDRVPEVRSVPVGAR